jgi:hypothetical protein
MAAPRRPPNSKSITSAKPTPKSLITPHALYCRYQARHDRAFNKALSDLIRLHGLRPREQNVFELKERKTPNTNSKFAPSKTAKAPVTRHSHRRIPSHSTGT